MSELYLDPSLYDYVDGLDHESYERFCMVVDACAKALQLMSMKPDVCTARAFGVTVRVQRNAEKNYYVICAIDIIELDPPPEGWGANAAALMETYFDIAPDCVSERALPKKAPPEADRGQRFIVPRAEEKIETRMFIGRGIRSFAVGAVAGGVVTVEDAAPDALALDISLERSSAPQGLALPICGSGISDAE